MSTAAEPHTQTRKIVIHKAGGHDRLRVEQVPAAPVASGQVRIQVAAAGVNFADTIVRMGLYASAKEYVGWPITPGFEVAGVVTEVGAGVSRCAVGDQVFAVTLFGGYSAEVVVDERHVFQRPAHLEVAQAAALPAIAMTAWYALFELAHPRRGQSVLVHSAAGGVGSALVQMARIAGCRVVGVVGSSHKVDAVRALGADEVIDKSTTPLWEAAQRLAPAGYDVILDANGVSTLKDSYKHLARPGKLVVYGFHSMMPRAGGRPNWPKMALDYVRTPRFNPLDMTNASASVLAFNLSYLFPRHDILHAGMTEIMGWLADGRMTAPKVTTYPLDKVAQAHADLESGKTIGKLVLLP
jgi:NADPH:quinone reductase-like Zn-dependent oxidoreductase